MVALWWIGLCELPFGSCLFHGLVVVAVGLCV